MLLVRDASSLRFIFLLVLFGSLLLLIATTTFTIINERWLLKELRHWSTMATDTKGEKEERLRMVRSPQVCLSVAIMIIVVVLCVGWSTPSGIYLSPALISRL